MNVSFEEIGALVVTVPAGTCGENTLCKIGIAGKADSCVSSDRFCGVAYGIRGQAAAVQIRGMITVPYSGTAPKPGFSKLCADGTGGVKVSEAGESYLTLAVDTAAKTVTINL